MSTARNFLDGLLGRLRVAVAGISFTERPTVNFIGATAVDNPSQNRTDVTFVGGGAAAAVASIAALKALSTIDGTVVNGQQRYVYNDPVPWTYSSGTGAGFAGDDTTSARPNDVMVGNNGRWYRSSSAPVLETYAAVRLAVTGAHQTVSVLSRTTLGDNAGGTFYLDEDDTTTADNGGTVLVAGTRRWKRRFSGATNGAWFGVRANAIQLTGAVRTSGDASLTDSSAPFRQEMEGWEVLLREPDPSYLAAGTLTIAGGGSPIAQGAGTNVLVALPPISGSDPDAYQPASGGAIYVNGSYYVALYGNDSLQQLTLFETSPTQSTKPWYSRTQRLATIVDYVSPTEVTLNITASEDQTGVWATLGTDDTDAIRAAVTETHGLGIELLEMPSGLSAISENIGFTEISDLTIHWPVGSALVDIRLISDEIPYPNADSYYGAFSLVSCSNIRLINASYDANCPSLSVVHSAGGSINNSGSRSGFVFYISPDCYMDSPTSLGFGARDEHVYCQGDCKNFTALNPNITVNNNVSLNFNGGSTGYTVIGGVLTGLLLGTDSWTVIGTEITTYGHARLAGGFAFSPTGHGVADIFIHDMNMLTAGTAVFDIFGSEVSNSSTKVKAKIVNVNGLWSSGNGAIVRVANNGGTLYLDLDIDKCTAYPANGRFVSVEAAVTGKTFIAGRLRGRAGSNLTIGVETETGGTVGGVIVDPSTYYGESVVTRLKPGTALGTLEETVTV